MGGRIEDIDEVEEWDAGVGTHSEEQLDGEHLKGRVGSL